MDAGADVLRAQALLLKVFLLIGGKSCSEYIRALTASILLWSNYEKSQHPCWLLFQHNASLFNEESGEISLSVLARDISRGGVRSDCKKVSTTFKLVKAKSELAQDIGIDLAGEDFGSDDHGRRIRDDSEEVLATTAYLRTVIRHILAGSYMHFDKDCGVRANRVNSARPTVPMAAFEACYRSVAPFLDAAVAKLRAGTESFWTVAHADIWPGAVPTLDFGSDQSDVEADENGAADDASARRSAKRNAAAGADGAVAKKKVKQVQDDAKLVGRVVAVPAWKFGAVWAGENYQKPRTAVLIGDITDVHPTRAHKPFNCAMREDEGYVIWLFAWIAPRCWSFP